MNDKPEAPERIWLWADVMASTEAEGETAFQTMVHTYEPRSEMGIVRYVRADASPLPPPGSEAEREMIEAALAEWWHRGARTATWGEQEIEDMRRTLRAAFGGSGGEGRSG